MNAPTAASRSFTGFGASFRACAALLGRSWTNAGFSLGLWSVAVALQPFRNDPPLQTLLAACLSAAPLLDLRTSFLQLGPGLPVAPRTRSLAVACAGTLCTLTAFALCAGLRLSVTGDPGSVLAPLTGILTAGGLSLCPEFSALWLIPIGGLGLVDLYGWHMGLFELRPWHVLLGLSILAGSRIPNQTRALPRAIPTGSRIADAAFPPGPADPTAAVRALLGAGRWASIAWRLAPLVVVTLLRFASPIASEEREVWQFLGWWGVPALAAVSFVLPISAFGITAADVAMQLPVRPLAVHHAVIREAAARAGLLFSIFLVHGAALSCFAAPTVSTPDDAAIGLVLRYLWVAPMFVCTLAAAAWVSYPSRLKVFLFKLGSIGLSPPLGTAAFIWAFTNAPDHPVRHVLAAYAVVTLLGLVALALGELRARRAFSPGSAL